MPTPYSDAALKAEIQSDPAHIGYSGKTAAQVAALLNAPTIAAYQAVPVASVLKWGAGNGVRLNIEQAATKAGTFAGISATDQGIALAVRDLLQGGYASLDVSDPAIVGAVDAGGTAYVPGGPAVTTPGMLDALVAGTVMTPAQKDTLIALGQARVSRLAQLFGPAAPLVDADLVLAAIRS